MAIAILVWLNCCAARAKLTYSTVACGASDMSSVSCLLRIFRNFWKEQGIFNYFHLIGESGENGNYRVPFVASITLYSRMARGAWEARWAHQSLCMIPVNRSSNLGLNIIISYRWPNIAPISLVAVWSLVAWQSWRGEMGGDIWTLIILLNMKSPTWWPFDSGWSWKSI